MVRKDGGSWEVEGYLYLGGAGKCRMERRCVLRKGDVKGNSNTEVLKREVCAEKRVKLALWLLDYEACLGDCVRVRRREICV